VQADLCPRPGTGRSRRAGAAPRRSPHSRLPRAGHGQPQHAQCADSTQRAAVRGWPAPRTEQLDVLRVE
jgi:hypothetical protein